MTITVIVLNTTLTESEGDISVDIEKGNYNDYSTFIIANRLDLLDTTEVIISVVSSDIMIIVVTSVGLPPSLPPSSSSTLTAPY